MIRCHPLDFRHIQLSSTAFVAGPDHGLKESNGFRAQMMWSASLAAFAALATILSKTMTRKLSKAVEATSTFCTGDLAALAAEEVSHSRLV